MSKAAASREPSVAVVVAWGSRVLQIRTIDRGCSFGLGDLAGDLPLPRGVRQRLQPPIVIHRGGCPQLVIPPGAQGWIRLTGSRPRSLDELLPTGHAFRSAPRRAFPEGADLPLEPGTTVRLEFGCLSLLISRSSSDARVALRPCSRVDRRLAASCAAAGVTLLAVLAAAAHVVPPLDSTRAPDTAPSARTYTILIGLNDSLAEQALAPDLASQPTDELYAEPGEYCPCGDLGAMGRPDEHEGEGRYGVRGPADNPDPHVARPLVQGDMLVSEWLLGVSPRALWRDDAPTAPWGRDDSLGTDVLSARGSMWGDVIRDAPGADGLGLVGVDGGLAKVIASEGRTADSAKRSPRVAHTGLRTAGPLKPSAILPVVAPRFSRFRDCYAQALELAPELRGRIDVRFQISRDGTTTDVHTVSTDISDPAVTSCLVSAFEGLSFPPSETKPTRVTYPLLFSP